MHQAPSASSASPRVRQSPGPAEMHSWSATTLPRCIVHHKFCSARTLLGCIMHHKLCCTRTLPRCIMHYELFFARTLHVLRHILCTSAAHGIYSERPDKIQMTRFSTNLLQTDIHTLRHFALSLCLINGIFYTFAYHRTSI